MCYVCDGVSLCMVGGALLGLLLLAVVGGSVIWAVATRRARKRD